MVEERKGFPILNSGKQTVDWQLVADHGDQVRKNHYQSVERLAQRGGLSWCELHAVLHNRTWRKMDENEAIIAIRALEAKYLAAHSVGSMELRQALEKAREFAVLFLAFDGRDRGTSRMEGTLDGLVKLAVDAEQQASAALKATQ